MKLLSEEMVSEMVARAQDPEVQDSFKGLSIRLALVAIGCPGNEDRKCTLIIENGKLANVEAVIKQSPSDMRTEPFDSAALDAKVISPFKTLANLIQERISLMTAFGTLKIEGSQSKLVNQIDGFIGFLKFIGTLPIDWQA